MKKIFLLPLLLCLFLVACDKEDKTEPTGPSANELIQGTWVTLEMKYELFNASGAKLTEKKQMQYDRFTFKNGNVIALDPLAQPTSTSYSVSGNSNNAPSLFMEVGSLPRAFAIASISNSSMTLQADNSGDTQN